MKKLSMIKLWIYKTLSGHFFPIIHLRCSFSIHPPPAARPVALKGQPGMGVRGWRIFSALAPDDTISFPSCFSDTNFWLHRLCISNCCRRPASLHFSLPPQPVRAAGWQPALWIRARFEPQINADIIAEIWLYSDFHRIIKIKIHTNRYLRSSVFICG